MESTTIDETNFDKYFFDVRKHRPQKGQIMARYTAKAELRDGQLKRDALAFLVTQNSAAPVTLLRRSGLTEKDAVKTCINMAEGILAGKSVDEVLKTNHVVQVEYFFYTKEEYVPENDPHWSKIKVKSVNA